VYWLIFGYEKRFLMMMLLLIMYLKMMFIVVVMGSMVLCKLFLSRIVRVGMFIECVVWV